jgi:hypothetical protein
MLPLQSLPAVFDDPTVYAVLVLVITAVVLYQRTLSWPEYRRLHGIKRRVLPVVDRYTSLFVVSRKGGHDDAEYIATVQDSVRVVFGDLVNAGGSPHLINSLKIRTNPETGERQYSDAHLVWTHDDGTQTEAYLFRLDDAHVDVYAHHEPGVRDAKDHLDGEQRDGDPRGVVRKALFVQDE